MEAAEPEPEDIACGHFRAASISSPGTPAIDPEAEPRVQSRGESGEKEHSQLFADLYQSTTSATADIRRRPQLYSDECIPIQAQLANRSPDGADL